MMTSPTDFCDICWEGEGFKDLPLHRCSDCGVAYHDVCYDFYDHDRCWPCQAVGKTFTVRKRDKNGQRIRIKVNERPTECALCGVDDKKPHAMNALFDTYGKTGRQILLPATKDKPQRLAWVHSVCALTINMSHHLIYGCFVDGSWEDDVEIDVDDRRDLESVNSQLEQESTDVSAHHFVFTMKRKHMTREERDFTRRIQEFQTNNKCIICGAHDNQEGCYRIAIQCNAGDLSEWEEFAKRKPHEDLVDDTCYLSVHVGCALFRPEEDGKYLPVRRVFCQPIEEKANIFCNKHGTDLLRVKCPGTNIIRYPPDQLAAAPVSLGVQDRKKRSRSPTTPGNEALTQPHKKVYQHAQGMGRLKAPSRHLSHVMMPADSAAPLTKKAMQPHATDMEGKINRLVDIIVEDLSKVEKSERRKAFVYGQLKKWRQTSSMSLSEYKRAWPSIQTRVARRISGLDPPVRAEGTLRRKKIDGWKCPKDFSPYLDGLDYSRQDDCKKLINHLIDKFGDVDPDEDAELVKEKLQMTKESLKKSFTKQDFKDYWNRAKNALLNEVEFFISRNKRALEGDAINKPNQKIVDVSLKPQAGTRNLRAESSGENAQISNNTKMLARKRPQRVDQGDKHGDENTPSMSSLGNGKDNDGGPMGMEHNNGKIRDWSFLEAGPSFDLSKLDLSSYDSVEQI